MNMPRRKGQRAHRLYHRLFEAVERSIDEN